MAPVEGKGVQENDGWVVGVLPPVRDGLQVLHQLHHLVIVLPIVSFKMLQRYVSKISWPLNRTFEPDFFDAFSGLYG